MKNNEFITVAKVVESDFGRVQKYLTQAPGTLDKRSFKTTIGSKLEEHETDYMNEQIDKQNGTVAPFTLKNMIAVEAGEAAADKILEMLSSQIAHSEFAQYLGGDGISAEELTALRQNIQDKVQEQMGSVGDALKAIDDATPEWYRKLEEGVQERLAAALGDDFRDVLANFEVPESFADQFCEAIVE